MPNILLYTKKLSLYLKDKVIQTYLVQEYNCILEKNKQSAC